MLPRLDENNDAEPFPSLDTALVEPNGLIAAGGTLNPERLINAYRCGIFPWFEEGQPILWWSPDPRLILKPDELHVSRRLKKLINKKTYHCTIDTAFSDVILACSEKRQGQDGTWITEPMIRAYENLFTLGYAHSVEVWLEDKLIGGLYGVSIGQVFFGESMFSRLDNASKVGFTFLCKQLAAWGYQLIDCQVHTDHLASLGALCISRDEFADQLDLLCSKQPSSSAWLFQ